MLCFRICTRRCNRRRIRRRSCASGQRASNVMRLITDIARHRTARAPRVDSAAASAPTRSRRENSRDTAELECALVIRTTRPRTSPGASMASVRQCASPRVTTTVRVPCRRVRTIRCARRPPDRFIRTMSPTSSGVSVQACTSRMSPDWIVGAMLVPSARICTRPNRSRTSATRAEPAVRNSCEPTGIGRSTG